MGRLLQQAEEVFILASVSAAYVTVFYDGLRALALAIGGVH